MKRVMASTAAVAFGAAGLQGANVTGLTPQEASKWWNVSASLRGFYDDNNLYAEHGAIPSFGTEFHPGFAVNLPLERTVLSASYRFTLAYYEARPRNNVDQQHEFDAQLNHKFTPRYSANLIESFVSTSEPAVVDQGAGAQISFQRPADFSVIRNRVAIDLEARLAPTFGVALGYQNTYYDYQNTGPGSLSALLDRTEQLFHLDGQWFPAEHTKLFVGYQFGLADYTSDDTLDPNNLIEVSPDVRNSRSHYLYVGGERQFSQQLSGLASVGAQSADYYNEGTTDLGPYVNLSGTYAYLPASTVKLEVKVSRYAADSALGTNGVTRDQLATTTYVSINHRITPRLSGKILGQYQHSIYNGGDLDAQADDYFALNFGFDFKIRENFFANLLYIWERRLSNRPEASFVRNRIYTGIRATY